MPATTSPKNKFPNLKMDLTVAIDENFAKLVKEMTDKLQVVKIYKLIIQIDEMLTNYQKKEKRDAETEGFYTHIRLVLLRSVELDRALEQSINEYHQAKGLIKYYMKRCADLEEQLIEAKCDERAEAKISLQFIEEHIREKIKFIKLKSQIS